MKNGQCSQCQSLEVYFVDSVDLAINLGAFKEAPLVLHVCTSCGSVELYVRDSNLLPKIAEKYVAVSELYSDQ